MSSGLGAVVVAAAALLLVAAPFAFLALGAASRDRWTGRALIGASLAFFAAWAVLAWDTFWPGSAVLAHGTSPDGREYCLVQGYQDVFEPYQVSLYIRDPAGVWWANTVDPDAASWRGATVASGPSAELTACNDEGYCRSFPTPDETIDLATVLPGYRGHYAPASYSCAQVLARHAR